VHTTTHQARLKAAGSDNLDGVIESIRAERPGVFHTDETLFDRRFVHQPLLGEPNSGFDRPFIGRLTQTA
jgi:hypothetical protein